MHQKTVPRVRIAINSSVSVISEETVITTTMLYGWLTWFFNLFSGYVLVMPKRQGIVYEGKN